MVFGQHLLHGRAMPRRSDAISSASPPTGPVATRASADSSSSNGWAPGTIDVTNQRSEPRTAPRREARDQTGPHDRRLARARGPTTVRNRPRAAVTASRSTRRSTRRERPKKSAASASWKASSPLYGLRSSPITVVAARSAGDPPCSACDAATNCRRRTRSTVRAPIGGLGGRPGEHVVDGGGTSGRDRSKRSAAGRELAPQKLGLGRASRERKPSGQGLEHGDRQPVDVGGRADRLSAELLRRGVGGRADRQRVDRRVRGRVHVGDAEVTEEEVAVVVEEDIGRLHVAMHHPGAVRERQRSADLGHHLHDRRRAAAGRRRSGPRGCHPGTGASPGRPSRARASSRRAARCTGARAGRRAGLQPRTVRMNSGRLANSERITFTATSRSTEG